MSATTADRNEEPARSRDAVERPPGEDVGERRPGEEEEPEQRPDPGRERGVDAAAEDPDEQEREPGPEEPGRESETAHRAGTIPDPHGAVNIPTPSRDVRVLAGLSPRARSGARAGGRPATMPLSFPSRLRVPTISKPTRWCRRTLASFSGKIPVWIVQIPACSVDATRRSSSRRPMPRPWRSGST